jgi:uncharacterized membrane protein YeaQ/YmgE (transglycosylase-associated protein family)
MEHEARPGKLHQIAYLTALLLGGWLGYRLGNEFSGFVLGIVGAVLGALVCSTLVGFIAMKVFGYKP